MNIDGGKSFTVLLWEGDQWELNNSYYFYGQQKIYCKRSYIDYLWQQVMEAKYPLGNYFNQKDSFKFFFTQIQRGDLCIQETIQNALMIVGFTKSGKTTLAHYLANNPLIGHLYQGSDIYKLATSWNSQAAIGQHCVSQTLIPNIIKGRIRQNDAQQRPRLIDIKIIDGPGYSDTCGCERLLLYNYFCYRTFSKIKNLKFVIVLDEWKLSGTFMAAIQVIKQFIHTFKDYNSIKEQIIRATSIVITKYRGGNIQNQWRVLMERVRFNQYQSYLKNGIQELLQTVKGQHRLYFMALSQPNIRTPNNNLLQQICSNSQYWRREVDKTTKQIDMTPIQCALGRKMFHLGLRGHFETQLELFNNILARIRQRTHILFDFDGNLGYVFELILMNALFLVGQQQQFFEATIKAFMSRLSPQLIGKQFYDIISQLNMRLGNQQKQQNKEPQIYTRMRIQFKRVTEIRYNLEINHDNQDIVMLQIVKKILRLLSNIQQNKISGIGDLAQYLLQILVGLKNMRFFNSPDKYNKYCKTVETFYYSIHRMLMEERVIKEILQTYGESKEERLFIDKALSNLKCFEIIRYSLSSIASQTYNDINVVDYLRKKLKIINI